MLARAVALRCETQARGPQVGSAAVMRSLLGADPAGASSNALLHSSSLPLSVGPPVESDEPDPSDTGSTAGRACRLGAMLRRRCCKHDRLLVAGSVAAVADAACPTAGSARLEKKREEICRALPLSSCGVSCNRTAIEFGRAGIKDSQMLAPVVRSSLIQLRV